MARTLKTARDTLAGNPPEELRARGQEAARYVRDEATAVAETARTHPTAVGSTLLLVATIAFVAGFVMGTSSAAPPARRFW